MEFLIVVIAIIFLQIWGAENPLHQDTWMSRWIESLDEKYVRSTTLFFGIAVGVPVVAAAFGFFVIQKYSGWMILPLGVLVLLYSFGRGEFASIVAEYTKACYIEDWPSALQRASSLGVRVDDVPEGDWSTLHQHVLDEAGYRGFERMFAVLFWFFIFGPVGALAYRIVFLFNQNTDKTNPSAMYLMWVMEWPAVRVLGLSFALTGNFVGCYRHWRESLACVKRSTISVLSHSILGALSVEDDLTQTCEVTRKELDLLNKLYTRTLWLWLGAASLPILIA